MQADIQEKTPAQAIAVLEQAFGLSRDDMARALDVNGRTVEQSSIAFDTLAAEWSPAYQEQRHPLLAWIAYARESLDK